MSFLHLHCVSKEGHKAWTAMPSRGLHSYRKVGLMQIDTPVKTLAHNDGVDQRAPLLARPTRLAVIADHWPNGADAFIAVGAGAAGRCKLFHGGHGQ